MTETTHRVLRLLGMLEARTSWQSGELAERLEVTERTVRRDITRLRELGYPVESDRGVAGGYRLGAGGRLPPLVLDDDEAVALVACLRMAALAGADQVGESALRALAKLDQVLPPRLRAIASAIDEATLAIPRSRPALDLQVLQQLATALRAHMLVRFDYRKPDGEVRRREVEPGRLMTQGQNWYLQGFDRDREDWRVFRLDRVDDLEVTTWRFTPRDVPSHEFTRDLASRFSCILEVEFAVDPARVAARIPAPHRERLEASDAGCRVTVGSGSWDDLAWHLLSVSRDLDTALILRDDAPEEFRRAMTEIAELATQLARTE